MGTSVGGSVKHYEAARDVSAHDPGLLFPKTNPGDAHVGEARRTEHRDGRRHLPRRRPPGAPLPLVESDKPVATTSYRRGVRVTFPRLADGSRSYSVVERSDGVRYRVFGGTATARLPHDLGHLVVERETGDHGGFWGAVAAGVVFSSMEHLDGRRPPHARERSDATMRERADGLRRAELMVWVTERVARDGVTDPRRIRALLAEALSSFPEAPIEVERVVAAAGAFRDAERRWAALAPGEELVLPWREDRRPAAGRRDGPRRRAAARARRLQR